MATAATARSKRPKVKEEQKSRQKTVKTTTLGAGLAFGGELVFSLGGIPLGVNVAVGQGFGREKTHAQSKGLPAFTWDRACMPIFRALF